MGNCNCIDFSPGISWVDDGEWGFWESEEETSNRNKPTSKQEEASKPSKQTETILTAPTEVKIKISKRQLEKLLEQADNKNLPMQDLLAGLVKISQSRKFAPDKDHRYWRPALQSIPEVAEH